MIIPVGEFLPDQRDFQNPGSSLVQNVVPRTMESYGPFGGLSAQFSALNARCQGARGFRDSTGNAHAFAGTATKLYHATTSAGWTDVSSKTYTISEDDYWSFEQFGDVIYASNFADGLFKFNMLSDSVFSGAALTGTAPKPKYLAVSKDFMLTAYTDDLSGGTKNQRVWWPAINDPTNWPAAGGNSAIAVLSDYQDVVGDWGDCTGIVANVGPCDAAVFFQRGVFRMMYAGQPDIWDFFQVHGARGCVSPQSLRATEIGVIYLGNDDFYLFDGQGCTGIGYQKIAKWFYSQIDQTNLEHVVAAVDPINKFYIVAWPSSLATPGTCDSMLICAYMQPSLTGTPGRWSYITGISVEYLFRSMSFGYTMDNMNSLGNLDSIGISLDSRVWSGNQEVLTAFDTTHTMNYFTGPNLAPTVETSETQPTEGNRTLITNAWPLVDGGTPSLQWGVRNRLIDSAVFNTAVPIMANGMAPQFAEGRYHRCRITLPANSSFNHIQGVEVPDESLANTGRA